MEKKTKQELLLIIEEQDKNLQLYKSRLHDIIGSYKNLIVEKETLQNSIKVLVETSTSSSCDKSEQQESILVEKTDECIQQLKSSLGALAFEKSRIENELRVDRKKILQQKEEVEEKLIEEEKKRQSDKQKYENQIQELKKKINTQQQEREKEQQDHVIMLKELQNIVANERAAKEKLEICVEEIKQKLNEKMLVKKINEYDEHMDELQHRLRTSQDCLKTSDNEIKRKTIMLQEAQKKIEKLKVEFQSKIDEERKRADTAEKKLELLLFVKEKRIESLESRISELSLMVGDNDKIRQKDQAIIHKLKAKLFQLQIEFSHLPTDDTKLLKFRDSSNIASEKSTDPQSSSGESFNEGIMHTHCQAELFQIKNELEEYKAKCEMAMKEKYNKTSEAMISDAKTGKEIKELKGKIEELQNQLLSCRSQLNLSEEFHSKITFNLEKSCEDLKLLHKQQIAQIEASYRGQLLEMEHHIQKQRERTLLLLEEKEKENANLKSSFLSSLIQKKIVPETSEKTTSESANILSQSLIMSKKDGHILYYAQELARKDVEISNLRQSRIQLESRMRQLQQSLAAIEKKYFGEVDALQSRIKLLEQDKEGTNVEYLKNVVLRLLRCNDRNSKKHMINAIATVLHFTNNEMEDLKIFI